MRVRSLVGLIPMLAVEVIDPKLIHALPEFAGRLRWFLRYRPDLAEPDLALDRAGHGRAQPALAAARAPA